MSGTADPSLRMSSTAYKTASSANELNEPSVVLKAAARHMGAFCWEKNQNYMRCKKANDGNPAKCLEQGLAVTKCGLQFFKTLRKFCEPELNAQVDCLKNNNHAFSKCRKTQSALDECVFDKMNVDGCYVTYDTTKSESSYTW
eukprot:m.240893 g.240893  ORF g.240893 m.240893 type:complete len:143 (+) comp16344_c0_seq1:72-500(+)